MLQRRLREGRLGQFVEKDFAVRLAVQVHKTLRQYTAQPSSQRTSAVIEKQRRVAFSVAGAQPVQVCIERIGKLAAYGIRSGDPISSVIDRLAVEDDELLPRSFISGSACPGEDQFLGVQSA